MKQEERRNNPWSVIKRILQGKPAFINPAVVRKKSKKIVDGDAWRVARRKARNKVANVIPKTISGTQPDNPLRDARGQRLIPELVYRRYNDHINGDDIDLWFDLLNDSRVALELCSIEIFGVTTAASKVIMPAEVESIHAYTGRMPQNTHLTHARITYRELYSGTHNVYCAQYQVLFRQYHDSAHYTIRGLKKDGRTRDCSI